MLLSLVMESLHPLTAHLTMVSHRRSSLSKNSKINSFQRQLQSHIGFGHTFFQKHQNRKALSSPSRNLRERHRMNSNRSGSFFFMYLDARFNFEMVKNDKRSKWSGFFWLIHSYYINRYMQLKIKVSQPWLTLFWWIPIIPLNIL